MSVTCLGDAYTQSVITLVAGILLEFSYEVTRDMHRKIITTMLFKYTTNSS